MSIFKTKISSSFLYHPKLIVATENFQICDCPNDFYYCSKRMLLPIMKCPGFEDIGALPANERRVYANARIPARHHRSSSSSTTRLFSSTISPAAPLARPGPQQPQQPQHTSKADFTTLSYSGAQRRPEFECLLNSESMPRHPAPAQRGPGLAWPALRLRPADSHIPSRWASRGEQRQLLAAWRRYNVRVTQKIKGTFE